MAERSAPSRPEPRVLSDSRAIRAMAHPARLAAIEALAGGTELTATQVAQAAGVSPSAMSYHLRALEKWGIVERVDSAADARERPWRVYPGGWSVNAIDDTAMATATSTVTGMLMSRIAGEMARWFDRARTESDEWQSASGMSNGASWLTAEEAEQLKQLHRSFLAERERRTPTDRPPGSRRVRVAQICVPLDPD